MPVICIIALSRFTRRLAAGAFGEAVTCNGASIGRALWKSRARSGLWYRRRSDKAGGLAWLKGQNRACYNIAARGA